MVVDPEVNAQPQRSVLARLKQLGDARDGVLVVASCVYIVGYMTWAIYCWRHHLGSARALDMQYFVIGGPVALAFALLVATIRQSRRALAAVLRRYYLLRPRTQRTIVLIAGGGASVLALAKVIGGDRVNDGVVLPIAIAFVFIQTLITDPKREVPLMARFYLVAVSLALATSFIVFYVTRAYEHIPQAFGGGRPRRAVLELKAADLSPAMLRRLASLPAPGTAMTVSDEVLVLARLSESLIVAPPNSSGEVVELRDETIVGIVWRD
jgi:hypothetical protein